MNSDMFTALRNQPAPGGGYHRCEDSECDGKLVDFFIILGPKDLYKFPLGVESIIIGHAAIRV